MQQNIIWPFGHISNNGLVPFSCLDYCTLKGNKSLQKRAPLLEGWLISMGTHQKQEQKALGVRGCRAAGPFPEPCHSNGPTAMGWPAANANFHRTSLLPPPSFLVRPFLSGLTVSRSLLVLVFFESSDLKSTSPEVTPDSPTLRLSDSPTLRLSTRAAACARMGESGRFGPDSKDHRRSAKSVGVCFHIFSARFAKHRETSLLAINYEQNQLHFRELLPVWVPCPWTLKVPVVQPSVAVNK